MAIRVRTADWEGGDRLDRWREEFGKHVARLEVTAGEAQPERFGLAMGIMPGAGVNLTSVAMTSVRKLRDRHWMADGDDSVSLLICTEGRVRYDTADRRAAMRPGQFTVLSNQVPILIEADAGQVYGVQIARAALPDPDLSERRVGALFDGGSPAAMLLRAYLDTLWRVDALTPLAERHLVELVAAALSVLPSRSDDPPGGSAVASARLARMRTMLAARSRAPGLDLAAFARLIGVSSRTAQRDFASADSSFGDELLARRLDDAHDLLVDLAGASRLSITEVAFMVGFSDLSHFNRTFRARFGCTPSETRIERTAGRADGIAEKFDGRRRFGAA